MTDILMPGETVVFKRQQGGVRVYARRVIRFIGARPKVRLRSLAGVARAAEVHFDKPRFNCTFRGDFPESYFTGEEGK